MALLDRATSEFESRRGQRRQRQPVSVLPTPDATLASAITPTVAAPVDAGLPAVVPGAGPTVEQSPPIPGVGPAKVLPGTGPTVEQSPPEIQALDTAPVETQTGAFATDVVDPTVEDLYGPEAPTAVGPAAIDVAAPTAATIAVNDPIAARVGVPGTARATTGALSQAAGAVGEQADLTSEQQVDAELARILGQDSPLLARAKQEAMRTANRRGLQNTSIAVGAAQGAMVDRALPMAQQNAAQGFQRTLANAGFRQEANLFTASEQNRLTALEAELGTQVNVFNADQLNQAESLAAQMRMAQEQQNTEAYNRASLQFTELQRSAEAQRADIAFAGEQQRSAEQQAYNQQIIDRVSQINEQYLRGTQAMDLATIQGTYNQIIATNSTAGSMYQSYFSGIASVMSNPDMTPSQIASSVNVMQRQLEASLRLIEEMNNMDFGGVGTGAPGGGSRPVTSGGGAGGAGGAGGGIDRRRIT